MKNILKNIPKDFLFFLAATCFLAFAQGIVDSIFNNFLSDTFHLKSIQRTFLELPRELPGFLVIFTSALFFFMCNRTLAAFSQIITAAGVILIGLYSQNYSIMLMWLFIYSSGQHMMLPLSSSIGMELASEGSMGRRLGQLSSAGNFASIIGFVVVFIGFQFFHLNYKISFLIAAVGFVAASILMFMMKKNKPVSFKAKFKMRKEYRLFYWLTILYGTRKQIFLTFAPWVLVSIFQEPTQTLAKLFLIGSIIGIFFKPALGHVIDKIGEKVVLASEAVLLIFVCFGYGFSRFIFPAKIALFLTFACFIADNLMMSVGMARATYMKKIAVHPDEVNSTLTMATTIDHIFSISIALLGGVIWNSVGYQWIFLGGALIAIVNFFSALRIKIPERHAQKHAPEFKPSV